MTPPPANLSSGRSTPSVDAQFLVDKGRADPTDHLIAREDNPCARRRCEKLGFQITGRKQQPHIVGREKIDVLMMDILAEEFAAMPLF
jgi:hypothetical protein